MLEQEPPELMPMPTAFDGYVQKSAKVSSTCLVSVARNRYSVPCELAGQRVSTRLYPTRIGVVANDAVAASHERLSDRGQVCYDWQHYITLLQRTTWGAEKRRALCRHACAIKAFAPRSDAPCWWLLAPIEY